MQLEDVVSQVSMNGVAKAGAVIGRGGLRRGAPRKRISLCSIFEGCPPKREGMGKGAHVLPQWHDTSPGTIPPRQSCRCGLDDGRV